ncbi:MAG: zinc ribbon domain-containing protein [Deltaproteobacteria bacterium]|nr:zinc ribbon domain-containing protein [Deltaproteobacteria bacterium]
MPIYEYNCSKCGVFEVTQRITEDPLKKCPSCRSKVRKLISNTSFQLKGSGWYITDYGRGKGSNGDKAEANGGKESSDSGKSTESKKSEKSSSGDSAAGTAS